MKIHPELYAPNVWPENDDEFREVYMEMGRLCHAVGETLLQGVAQSYNLEDSATFTKLVHGAPHVFRALRYLPLTTPSTSSSFVMMVGTGRSGSHILPCSLPLMIRTSS